MPVLSGDCCHKPLPDALDVIIHVAVLRQKRHLTPEFGGGLMTKLHILFRSEVVSWRCNPCLRQIDHRRDQKDDCHHPCRHSVSVTIINRNHFFLLLTILWPPSDEVSSNSFAIV